MNISFLKEKGNKYLIFILLGVLVLVILIPTRESMSKKEETISTAVVSQSDLEIQLESILSAMEGVGKVEVMITAESKGSSLFDSNVQTRSVTGVVVVAQGAGNALVETRISDVVKALFSIEAHKISIVKMRS